MIVRSPRRPSRIHSSETFADLLQRLGDVAPERIRLDPWPGKVTDEDVAESKDRFGCLCELVDGVLVEKIMGVPESALATELSRMIKNFLDEHPLGMVCGPDGPVRFQSRLIRMPDISFFSWDRIPGDRMEEDAMLGIVPDLVVEVISPGNRPGEMRVKLQEYFQAGVRLAWYIHFKQRKAQIYTSIDDVTDVSLNDCLDGGDVLPGFRVRLQTVYDRAFPTRPKKKRGK
ncbi:MAG TPA: Uma2 family endonuclease [Pirellulaceae bacterium]|nr:Uma2 family endonuclease [Pirellulaceae bacterium]